MNYSTKKMVSIAMLSAVASVLFMIEIPIVLFYKLDLSNLPVLLGTFTYGPFAGVIILFIKDLLGLLHSSSGGIGELADFLAAVPFVLICGYLYKNSKTKKIALISMSISTVLSSIVSVLLNAYVLIPLFLPDKGLDGVVLMAQKAFPFIENGWQFLLYITAPFNLLKGFVISLLTFAIYKKLSAFLLKEGRL